MLARSHLSFIVSLIFFATGRTLTESVYLFKVTYAPWGKVPNNHSPGYHLFLEILIFCCEVDTRVPRHWWLSTDLPNEGEVPQVPVMESCHGFKNWDKLCQERDERVTLLFHTWLLIPWSSIKSALSLEVNTAVSTITYTVCSLRNHVVWKIALKIVNLWEKYDQWKFMQLSI